MSGMSGFLAALAGGLGGLGDGLQLNEQMKARAAQLKMAQDEAEARRRAESLQQLVTRDQLGLVQAPQYQGVVGQMLKATPQASETGTGLDSLMAAIKPAAGAIALQKERPATVQMQDPVSRTMAQYIMDPTQSRGARDRAAAHDERLSDYRMERADTIADRGAQQSAAAASKDASNRAAFNALATLYPDHPAAKREYMPGTDYNFVADNVAKTAQQKAVFAQQMALQREQTAGQMRVAGVRAAASDDASKATDGERKSAGYLEMARKAVPILDNATQPGRVERMLAATGLNEAVSDKMQSQWQAGLQFADAWLRFTSGANAPEPEIVRNARTFTAMPGDSPATILQKQEARKTAMRAMEIGAGRGAGAVTPLGAAPNVANDRPPLTTFVRPR